MAQKKQTPEQIQLELEESLSLIPSRPAHGVGTVLEDLSGDDADDMDLFWAERAAKAESDYLRTLR